MQAPRSPASDDSKVLYGILFDNGAGLNNAGTNPNVLHSTMSNLRPSMEEQLMRKPRSPASSPAANDSDVQPTDGIKSAAALTTILGLPPASSNNGSNPKKLAWIGAMSADKAVKSMDIAHGMFVVCL